MSKEPHIKDQSNTGKISQKMSEFITDLRVKIQKDDEDRTYWKEKMVVAVNQRLGVKRYSEYPYPGAPDIPLPETDKLIKKQVPNLVLSAWSPKEMCIVDIKSGYAERPEWKEKAKKSQAAMNTLLRSKQLGWFNKLYLAADYAKQHGHCIFKVREEFRSREVNKVIDLDEYPEDIIKQLKRMPKAGLRKFIADRFFLNVDDEDDIKAIDDAIDQLKSGERVIEFIVEEIESFPTVDVPLPTKIIVPSYTTDINNATRITYEYFLSRQVLEGMMEQEIFRVKDLDSMALSTTDDDILEIQKSRNEGVGDNTAIKELFRIHETVTYYREKDTDSWQRWVFVTLADVGDAEESLLQDNEFPYEFSGWNYEKWDNERKDERYYNARGLPEQIRAYQDIMERSINNMLIRDEMINTPMWEVLNTSQLMNSKIRFAPGDKLPVKSIGGEIAPIGIQSQHDVSSDRIMQLIKANVEEYQSSSDLLFRNASNAGGGKTLGEIQTGIQQNSGPLNLEVISWNECLTRVYQKMFEIMKERLGESIWVEGIEVTREDFNFPAEIRSNGDLEVSNQAMATQKAFARLNVLLNPALADVVDSEDRYNSLKDWLEKDGVKNPDLFCTNPIEIVQSQLKQMQGQLQQAQQQMAQVQQQTEAAAKEPGKGKAPITYKDLPPEGQIQMAGQAGIRLSPMSVMKQKMEVKEENKQKAKQMQRGNNARQA